MDRNMTKQDTIVGVLYIPVETLRDQQKIEDWFNLEDPNNGYGESGGRIRLQLWWIHSKTKLIEDRIIQTEEDIDKILGDKKYYQEKVSQLREPFNWLEVGQYAANNSPGRPSDTQLAYYHSEIESEDDNTEKHIFVKAAPRVGKMEKTMAKSFESVSDNLSLALGIRRTPWFKIMQYFNIVYTLLTLVTLFLRSDFINLTVCVLIYYCIAFVNSIPRYLFRLILVGLVFSWFSDFMWFLLHTSTWWDRAAYDGDVELTLRRVVVIISYLSFLFRIFVIVIFWKLSVDFNRLIRNRNRTSESNSFIIRNQI